jgi:hypothetical protein
VLLHQGQRFHACTSCRVVCQDVKG